MSAPTVETSEIIDDLKSMRNSLSFAYDEDNDYSTAVFMLDELIEKYERVQ